MKLKEIIHTGDLAPQTKKQNPIFRAITLTIIIALSSLPLGISGCDNSNNSHKGKKDIAPQKKSQPQNKPKNTTEQIIKKEIKKGDPQREEIENLPPVVKEIPYPKPRLLRIQQIIQAQILKNQLNRNINKDPLDEKKWKKTFETWKKDIELIKIPGDILEIPQIKIRNTREFDTKWGENASHTIYWINTYCIDWFKNGNEMSKKIIQNKEKMKPFNYQTLAFTLSIFEGNIPARTFSSCVDQSIQTNIEQFSPQKDNIQQTLPSVLCINPALAFRILHEIPNHNMSHLLRYLKENNKVKNQDLSSFLTALKLDQSEENIPIFREFSQHKNPAISKAAILGMIDMGPKYYLEITSLIEKHPDSKQLGKMFFNSIILSPHQKETIKLINNNLRFRSFLQYTLEKLLHPSKFRLQENNTQYSLYSMTHECSTYSSNLPTIQEVLQKESSTKVLNFDQGRYITHKFPQCGMMQALKPLGLSSKSPLAEILYLMCIDIKQKDQNEHKEETSSVSHSMIVKLYAKADISKETLIFLLQCEDPATIQAGLDLIRIKKLHIDEYKPNIKQLLNSKNNQTKIKALQMIGNTKLDDLKHEVLQVYKSNSGKVKAEAIIVLGIFKDRSIIKDLHGYIYGNDDHLANAALYFIALLHDEESIQILAKSLETIPESKKTRKEYAFKLLMQMPYVPEGFESLMKIQKFSTMIHELLPEQVPNVKNEEILSIMKNPNFQKQVFQASKKTPSSYANVFSIALSVWRYIYTHELNENTKKMNHIFPEANDAHIIKALNIILPERQKFAQMKFFDKEKTLLHHFLHLDRKLFRPGDVMRFSKMHGESEKKVVYRGPQHKKYILQVLGLSSYVYKGKRYAEKQIDWFNGHGEIDPCVHIKLEDWYNPEHTFQPQMSITPNEFSQALARSNNLENRIIILDSCLSYNYVKDKTDGIEKHLPKYQAKNNKKKTFPIIIAVANRGERGWGKKSKPKNGNTYLSQFVRNLDQETSNNTLTGQDFYDVESKLSFIESIGSTGERTFMDIAIFVPYTLPNGKVILLEIG